MQRELTKFAFVITIAAAACTTAHAESSSSAAGPPRNLVRAATFELPQASISRDTKLPGIERMFAGHRFIGLGEATHGTHEIFELKTAIVKALVVRGGVKAIAFESSYGSTLAASDYVTLRGKGDLRGALASLRIPTYQTEEIAELLTALREINAVRPAARRVQLFGYDVQDPRGDVRVVLEFLNETKSGPPVSDVLAKFAAGKGPVQTIAPAEVPALKAAIVALRTGFQRNKATIVARSSARQYARYLQALTVALQSLSLFDAKSQMAAYYMRDTLAATNVEWVAATVGGPVVIWAHNSHIAKDNEVAEFVTLGEALARAHGSDYFAMGSAFFDGTVRAVFGGKLVPNELGAPQAGSFEHFLLQQGGDRNYVIDLRKAAKLSPEWRARAAAATTLRAIGAAYQPEAEDRTYRPVTPSAMYDALAFVRHSTASVPYDVAGATAP